MNKCWSASMPSNIAIVKYMGKLDYDKNDPLNPSCSMCLDDFRTKVEIELLANGKEDVWEPISSKSSYSPDLPSSYGDRFLKFFVACKKEEAIFSSFVIRSQNNFPGDCGLASSASSFAALATAMENCFSELKDRKLKDKLSTAYLSKSASGSSCRSFFAPWCIWEKDNIYTPESNMTSLVDLVLIVSKDKKKITSSDAHKRVQSSSLFSGRELRAKKRIDSFKQSLKENNFRLLAEIAWEELWEMHSFFHTAKPPFFYLTPESLDILYFAQELWEKEDWGPAVTVDAGPNVHLLIPRDERDRLLDRIKTRLPQEKLILESSSG